MNLLTKLNNGSITINHGTKFILKFNRPCIFVLSNEIIKSFTNIPLLMTIFENHNKNRLHETAIDLHGSKRIEIFPFFIFVTFQIRGAIKMTGNSIGFVVGLKNNSPSVKVQFIKVESQWKEAFDVCNTIGFDVFDGWVEFSPYVFLTEKRGDHRGEIERRMECRQKKESYGRGGS